MGTETQVKRGVGRITEEANMVEHLGTQKWEYKPKHVYATHVSMSQEAREGYERTEEKLYEYGTVFEKKIRGYVTQGYGGYDGKSAVRTARSRGRKR